MAPEPSAVPCDLDIATREVRQRSYCRFADESEAIAILRIPSVARGPMMRREVGLGACDYVASYRVPPTCVRSSKGSVIWRAI